MDCLCLFSIDLNTVFTLSPAAFTRPMPYRLATTPVLQHLLSNFWMSLSHTHMCICTWTHTCTHVHMHSSSLDNSSLQQGQWAWNELKQCTCRIFCTHCPPGPSFILSPDFLPLLPLSQKSHCRSDLLKRVTWVNPLSWACSYQWDLGF